MERVCARGARTDVKGWKCKGRALFMGDNMFKLCPGCGAMTEKVSGFVSGLGERVESELTRDDRQADVANVQR